MSDESQFESMLSKISVTASHSLREAWQDDYVPVSREEFDRGLRETVAMARERGWIPKDDPGCECLTCRLWRDAGW